MRVYVQTEKCDCGAVLGKGVNAEVFVWESPMFPGSVVKIGNQKQILLEADMLASMRHPGIVCVFAVVGRHHVQPRPDATGYMIMERLGSHIRQYTDGRSVLLHVSFALDRSLKPFHSFIQTHARQAQQAQLGTYRSSQLSPTSSVMC